MRDSREELDVHVAPNSQVFRTDAALGRYRGGLRKYKPGTAYGAAPQVYEVPVVRESIYAGVFAHRRDHDTVRQSNIANWKRIEYLRHVFLFEIFGIIPIAGISGYPQTSLKVIALDAAERQPGAEIDFVRGNRSVGK